MDKDLLCLIRKKFIALVELSLEKFGQNGTFDYAILLFYFCF